MPWSAETLTRGLDRLLPPDRIMQGLAVARVYNADAYTVERHAPTAVVLPTSTAEVQQIVRFCAAEGIPFTARGAGTGLSGGAMPALGGVVISTKKMTSFLEIRPKDRAMRVQTGAVNQKVSQAVAGHGLHFAPDPSSQSVSTIGGNIAENSGGPHTLKYGVTAPHILGLTWVDSQGEICEIGGPAGSGPGLDALSLMVGSEGILGIVTEAWIRLTPLPERVETVLAAFPSVREATQAVSAIVASGVIPAALEMMDHAILSAVRAAFGLEYPEGTRALLLVECDGSPDAATAEINQVVDLCASKGAISVTRAANNQERAQLWLARKKGVGAMGRLAPTIVTHDGVIPPSRLPEMLDEVYRIAEEAGVGVANLFHAGDGNLHPIFYFDERNPGKVDAVVAAGEKIIRLCLELGGSVTGEHGVGVEKADLLRMMYDEPSLQFQRQVREIFGSTDLCNPCKVIPDAKGCVEHKVRWRGVAT